MKNMKKAILMSEKDNVATALMPVKKKERTSVVFNNKTVAEIDAFENIEMYHKIAVKPIDKGEPVYKYGEVIGKATQHIKTGEHVHVNNIESVMTK